MTNITIIVYNIPIITTVTKQFCLQGETMNKLKTYLSLLDLSSAAAEELGLSGMTNADRAIIMHIWKTSGYGREEYLASYDDLPEHADMSRAQFYKSIRKLVSFDIIIKVGSERSGTYKLNLND